MRLKVRVFRPSRALSVPRYPYIDALSLMLLRTACDPDDKVARLALECVAEMGTCPDGEIVPAVQHELAKRSLVDFLKRFLVMLSDPKGVLEGRMSFIVVNLAHYLGPELLWTELVQAELDVSAYCDSRLSVSHESQSSLIDTDIAAHKLCQIFLLEPEFAPVRQLIRGLETEGARMLFEKTYK